jgi:hypothetical protein
VFRVLAVVMVMPMNVFLILILIMIVDVILVVPVGMAPDLHVSTQTASAFFAHIKLSPPKRFPVPGRAAIRCRTDGRKDIRS